MTMIEFYGLTFSLQEFIFITCFALFFILQLFFFILKAVFILSNRKKRQNPEYPPLSVIVPSRNYEEELKIMLPVLLNQNYPDFQVVVVNDCSSDGTEWYLSNLKLEYSNLKTTRIIQETDFPNALALTVGIRAASNEWLIFIHPLCTLPENEWLKSYAENFISGKEAVFGYVNYSKSEGKFHNILRYENFNSFLLAGAASYLGMPIPMSDINIAYKRSAFLDRKGFAGVLETPFCENELFMNEISTRKNSFFIMRKDASLCISDQFGWFDFMNFKKKQLLLKQKYRMSQRTFLWTEASSRFGFDITMIVILFLSPLRLWIAGFWLFKNILELIWGIIAMKRLGEKNLFPWIGFYKSITPIINNIIFVNQLFIGNKRKWK